MNNFMKNYFECFSIRQLHSHSYLIICLTVLLSQLAFFVSQNFAEGLAYV